MRALRCDRCGKFYERPLPGRDYDIKKAFCSCSLDLCPTCSVELKDWFEKYKLEETKDVQRDVQPNSGESCSEGLYEVDGESGEEGKEEVDNQAVDQQS